MFKTFLKGLVFGLGFSISMLAVFWGVAEIQSFLSISRDSSEINFRDLNAWNDLSINEKIEKSTAIAIVRFRDGDDGEKQAYIDQIHLRNNNIELSISVADRIKERDYFASEHGGNRNGEIIFFTGSTGIQRGVAFLYDDRLIAYGDMPLSVFLKRFELSKDGSLQSELEVPSKEFHRIEGFQKLSPTEMADQSSAILLTKFEVDPVGDVREVVDEILSRCQGVELFYDKGDVLRKKVERLDLYGDSMPLGHIVFMDGNPADIRISVPYDEDDVRGLNKISIELFRRECAT